MSQVNYNLYQEVRGMHFTRIEINGKSKGREEFLRLVTLLNYYLI